MQPTAWMLRTSCEIMMTMASAACNSDHWCESSLGLGCSSCYPWLGFVDEWLSLDSFGAACVGALGSAVGLPRFHVDGELPRSSAPRWRRGALAPPSADGGHSGVGTCVHIPPAGLRIASWNTRGLLGSTASAQGKKESTSAFSGHMSRPTSCGGRRLVVKTRSCERCRLLTRSGTCWERSLKVMSVLVDPLFSFANLYFVTVVFLVMKLRMLAETTLSPLIPRTAYSCWPTCTLNLTSHPENSVQDCTPSVHHWLAYVDG